MTDKIGRSLFGSVADVLGLVVAEKVFQSGYTVNMLTQ